MNLDSQKIRLTAPPTLETLKNIGLFGALSDETLTFFLSTVEVRVFDAGVFVCRENEHVSEMFVVLVGELEVLKRSKKGIEARVALLGPGDWVGEMAIVDVQPRSASVVALSPVKLLRISTESLDGLYRRDLKAYSLFVLNIARELSRRLRVADSILADMMANVLDSYIRPRELRDTK